MPTWTDKEADEVLIKINAHIHDVVADRDTWDNFYWMYQYIKFLRNQRNAYHTEAEFVRKLLVPNREDV